MKEASSFCCTFGSFTSCRTTYYLYIKKPDVFGMCILYRHVCLNPNGVYYVYSLTYTKDTIVYKCIPTASWGSVVYKGVVYPPPPPPPPMLIVGGLARLLSSAICYPQTNPPTPFVSAWSGGLVGGRNTLVITAPDNPICPHSCQPLVSLSPCPPSSRPQYVPVDVPPRTVVVTYWQLPVDSHFVCNH